MPAIAALLIHFAVATGALFGSDPVAIQPAATLAPTPTGSFDWPLHPRPEVVREFQPPPKPWNAGHRGVDLRATAGDEVTAAGEGVVTHSGVIAGRGTVTVTHPDGRRTTYEPLDDRVATGTTVTKGERIGVLAAGHCSPYACLHWGLLVGPKEYRDPLTLIETRRVILLPN